MLDYTQILFSSAGMDEDVDRLRSVLDGIISLFQSAFFYHKIIHTSNNRRQDKETFATSKLVTE